MLILVCVSDDRSITDVVKNLVADISHLFRSEIALAKTEMQANIARVGTGAGLFGGAGIVGLFGLEFLLLAAMFGLIAAGLGAWIAALIVGVILFAIGGVLAARGKKAVSAGIAPTHAIEHAKQDVAAIKADLKDLRSRS